MKRRVADCSRDPSAAGSRLPEPRKPSSVDVPPRLIDSPVIYPACIRAGDLTSARMGEKVSVTPFCGPLRTRAKDVIRSRSDGLHSGGGLLLLLVGTDLLQRRDVGHVRHGAVALQRVVAHGLLPALRTY